MARKLRIDRRDILGHAGPHLVRHPVSGNRLGEVPASDHVGAEAEVEHPELELHAREIGLEKEHALERCDRTFEVAGPGREGGEMERLLEIGRIVHHRVEGGVDFRRFARRHRLASVRIRLAARE